MPMCPLQKRLGPAVRRPGRRLWAHGSGTGILSPGLDHSDTSSSTCAIVARIEIASQVHDCNGRRTMSRCHGQLPVQL